MVLTNGKKPVNNIEINSNTIFIENLQITEKDIVDYLAQIPPEERQQAIIRALEVGVFCLERTQISQDTDFVRRQLESLLHEVNQGVSIIPETVEVHLLSKLGTGEGQALAPIHTLLKQVSGETQVRLNEVKTLLSQDIDPAKESSVLGKALRELKNLLDSKRQDSVQGVFTAALEKATASNGTLAKAVKEVVAEAVKPLADEVDRLGKEIRGQEAAQSALLNTTAKGFTYEDEVVFELQAWSKLIGVEVNYVGTDNKPGDILINFTSKSGIGADLSIIIETKDISESWGRKRISDHLDKAMGVRGATAGIFLCRSCDGLAREIGEWAEGESGQGCWVATTHHLLTTAIRFLVVQQKLTVLRASQPEIDSNSVQAQLQRIRTTLKRITNINTQLNTLRKSADAIASEVDMLKQEIRDALDSIEDAIRG